MKNLCGKTRPDDNPYEIWIGKTGWEWRILKKYQADDDKPYARAFCKVFSPFCPNGEFGDVYIAEIKTNASLVEFNYECKV